MQNLLLKTTVLGFALALATQTPASPIGPVPTAFTTHPSSADFEAYGLRSLGWGSMHARQHHAIGRSACLRKDGTGLGGIRYGINRDSRNKIRFHPALCGKAPGAGWFTFRPDEPGVPMEAVEPDEESADSDEEETQAWVAESCGKYGESKHNIPAIPEPGSMALMGAGLLGLLAARTILKNG